MDQNWFLQKCSYENHVSLVRAGVLPSDLFAESKRDYIWAQNATSSSARVEEGWAATACARN